MVGNGLDRSHIIHVDLVLQAGFVWWGSSPSASFLRQNQLSFFFSHLQPQTMAQINALRLGTNTQFVGGDTLVKAKMIAITGYQFHRSYFIFVYNCWLSGTFWALELFNWSEICRVFPLTKAVYWFVIICRRKHWR